MKHLAKWKVLSYVQIIKNIEAKTFSYMDTKIYQATQNVEYF